ncbi:MAG TPA: response regulator [candidate division Zixibacteria bacterium]|nr:response regulator [candidate division Zixibacteria bacterium]
MAKKILIVDDNPNMSSLLVEMLEVFNYDALRATDGHDALEKAGQNEIAMVITDMRMPKMSGLELLQAIKEKRPSLPVVMISGYSIDEVDSDIVESKADGFLNKPFMMADIEKLLSDLL